MSTVVERVARGVEFLDVECPGWADRVDLARLNMAHQNDCMLGQLYGWYMWSPVESSSAAGLGFKPLGRSDVVDAEALAAEWRRVITARRTGGAA